MTIAEICTREVVVAKRDITVKGAARLMREYHVGCIVLVDEQEGKRKPCGIVTDRDIVVAVTALGLDPEVIRAGDVAAKELLELSETAGVAETVAVMRMKGVRRLPVVDQDGVLIGIIAADDILGLLAEELAGLATMVAREHRKENAERRTAVPGHA
ncbi:MAG: CBS domain-containing protein [Betaproteobacteria bacterium]|nr:MAG: CBS domain-containing protein [Betaproteobacteria bacterium]